MGESGKTATMREIKCPTKDNIKYIIFEPDPGPNCLEKYPYFSDY